MIKIATHDSATGERSKNLLHALGKVFAQTQTKTIKEQYEAGVRYFDIRVDKDLVLCHGLWKADKDFADLLVEMRKYVTERVYMRVIIERKYPSDEIERIQKTVRNLVNLHGKHVKLTYIAQKIPWKTLKDYYDVPVRMAYLSVPTPKEYLTMPYKDWRRYIPIPRILKKITPKVEFDKDRFTMVDFV